MRRRGRAALGPSARRRAAGAGVAPRARRAAPRHAALEPRAAAAAAAARRRTARAPRTGGTHFTAIHFTIWQYIYKCRYTSKVGMVTNNHGAQPSTTTEICDKSTIFLTEIVCEK